MTLAILKPDTIAAGNAGKVLAHLEREGFRIRGLKVVHLTRAQAEGFTPSTGSGRSSAPWWSS